MISLYYKSKSNIKNLITKATKPSFRIQFMMSRACLIKGGTSLIRPLKTPNYRSTAHTHPIKNSYVNRSEQAYATYTLNDLDKNTQDPQAQKNNPPTPHFEIYRQRCDYLGCNGLVCSGLCGPFRDRKAVAHATHGHPPKELGKITKTGSHIDLAGKNKQQNFVIYEHAHDVSPKLENIKGTYELNNNQQMMITIKKNEDKN